MRQKYRRRYFDPKGRWEARFRALERFCRRLGHPNVPVSWKPDPALGNWLASQRGQIRTGRINPLRRARLLKLGIGVHLADERWNERFREFVTFKRRYGHTKVLRKQKGFEKLGMWMHGQRNRRRQRTLSAAQIRRLNRAGFPWKPIRPPGEDQKWMRHFARLREFMKDTPLIAMSHRHPLGNWVHTQRKAAASGRLRPERKRRLTAIGFVWTKNDALWERGLEKATAYKKKNGTLPRATGAGLPNWLWIQRRRQERNALRPDREKRLRAIGYDFLPPHQSDPRPMLEFLARFRSERGHLDVRNGREFRPLWAWAQANRQLAEKGQLDPRTRRELDRLGFPWTPEEVEWESQFALLVERRRRGVKGRPDLKISLGRWLAQQQRLCREGELPLESEARLAALGMLD